MRTRIAYRFVPGQEAGCFRRLASRREPLAGGEPVHSREERVPFREAIVVVLESQQQLDRTWTIAREIGREGRQRAVQKADPGAARLAQCLPGPRERCRVASSGRHETIDPRELGTVLTAHATARFTSSCARTVCTLDGRSSTDEWAIQSYTWDLGTKPGTTSSGATVTVDYKRNGSFTVRLTVRDRAGQASSVIQTITIRK